MGEKSKRSLKIDAVSTIISLIIINIDYNAKAMEVVSFNKEKSITFFVTSNRKSAWILLWCFKCIMFWIAKPGDRVSCRWLCFAVPCIFSRFRRVLLLSGIRWFIHWNSAKYKTNDRGIALDFDFGFLFLPFSEGCIFMSSDFQPSIPICSFWPGSWKI